MKREIISRARWGARHEDGFGYAPIPAREVWLHHSVTIAPGVPWVDTDRDGVQDREENAMRVLEDIGESRFGRGISYTFAVMPSGRIYQGHGVARQGAHTANRNSIARAIVLVGNYEDNRVTEEQITSVAWLLQNGKYNGWWKEAQLDGGHRQAPGASTKCPGRYAMAVIGRINKLAGGAPIPSETKPPQKEEEEDMSSVMYVRGDSKVNIPNSKWTWGDITFLVEWDVQEGVSRKRIVNGSDAGLRLWQAVGRKVAVVPQEVLDAVGKQFTVQEAIDALEK